MRVIYAGGGTGGHINPAISVADYAKDHDSNHKALFIGTKSGLETRLVPKAGYDIKYIDVIGFDRRHPLKAFKTVKKLIKSRQDCKKIIREFKPDCVVCTGGYVSGPVMMAAFHHLSMNRMYTRGLRLKARKNMQAILPCRLMKQ